MRGLQQFAIQIADRPRRERGDVRSQVIKWISDYKDTGTETDAIQLGKLRLGKLTGHHVKRMAG